MRSRPWPVGDHRHACLKDCTHTSFLNLCAGADTAAVLDHGSNIFVWLGSGLPAAPGAETLAAAPDTPWTRGRAEAACQQLMGALAAGRFPVPECRTVLEVRAREPRLYGAGLMTGSVPAPGGRAGGRALPRA